MRVRRLCSRGLQVGGAARAPCGDAFAPEGGTARSSRSRVGPDALLVGVSRVPSSPARAAPLREAWTSPRSHLPGRGGSWGAQASACPGPSGRTARPGAATCPRQVAPRGARLPTGGRRSAELGEELCSECGTRGSGSFEMFTLPFRTGL